MTAPRPRLRARASRLLLIVLSAVLPAILPLSAEERQRIASSKPVSLEGGARLDWRLSPQEGGAAGGSAAGGSEAGGGAALDAAGIFDLTFGGLWSFTLRVPASLAFRADAGTVQASPGDISLGAGLTGSREALRWRADLSWTAPTGESSPWRIRDGALPSGGGTQRFGAEFALSLIRDPVVLSCALGADTALPQRVPSGRLWRAGELRASFALHEALNDQASWSISATPALTLPSLANGRWTARGPEWSLSIAVQAGWYPEPFAFRSGTQSSGGAWAWIGSAGVRKEWKR